MLNTPPPSYQKILYWLLHFFSCFWLMEPAYEMSFSQWIDLIDSPTLWTFHWIRIPRWQHVEDAEVKLEWEKENEAPNVLPEPPKKKRRTKKADITSMERIDSFMSNTYLGKMRAVGQIQKAPISRTFFEKTSERSRKRNKARRQERRVIRIWLRSSSSLERKNSSGFDETIFLVLKRYLLVFALVSLFRNI